ncbi:CRISPR-associated protein Cas6 [Dissulfurispira thermophila]|uniref:CRISPR-associated protein Cas6 n=1 Tax=Dissulfurispira thermophila TaxID=2715679 RepID=A0A7G1H350_9BACT|nr:hypothetical protein [Dissulfurispira thermophila]BCB96581.1 CRISPR-associated protein Cas6 [Dissulfurispira thermophila]
MSVISDPSFLNKLYFYRYRINLKPEELIHLPLYKGSALRGAFGYALKKAICVVRETECDDCILKTKCVYSSIMESPMPEGHPYHRKYIRAPHPYIIIPQLTRQQYFSPDDLMFFEIVLIGKANEFLPYFIYTFTEMGRFGIGRERGRFDVISVDALALDGSSTEIFNSIDKLLKTTEHRIDYNLFVNSPKLSHLNGDDKKFRSDEVTILFETPARIKSDDRLATDLPFQLLIKRLIERAFILANLYCGAEFEDTEEFVKDSEHVEVVTNKLRWMDWERYSSRQGKS